LRSKLEIQDRITFDLEEENRSLKRDIAQTKTDCENMLAVMEGNENEISIYQKKEKLVQQLSEDARKKQEEAALEKDRVLLKEKQYLSQIQKLQDETRQDRLDRQEKHNTMVDNMKSK